MLVSSSMGPDSGMPSPLRRSPDVVLVLAPDFTVLYVNPAVERILGHPPHKLVGGKILDYLHPEEADRVVSDITRRSEESGRLREPLELRLRHADGTWRRLQVVGVESPDSRDKEQKVYYLRDLSRQETLEEELVRRAFHDPLTGLANRDLFMDRLNHALSRAARHTRHRSPVAVLFLDLDGFKAVNDSVGHASGDDLLIKVARRVSSCLRAGDTAARIGGDEFAVLLDEGIDATSAALVAGRILQALSSPVIQNGEIFCVTASIGVATSESGFEEGNGLLQAADDAMYTAKRRGGGDYEVYEKELAAGTVGRLQLESELRRAAGQRELSIYHQPQVALDTGKIVGMEALLRWESPERGLVQPGEFMPLIERTDFIIPVGLWVLREACAQGASWRGRYPERELSISVNLSVRQLLQPTFVDQLSTILRDTELAPGCLVLEITESLIMNRTQRTTETLDEIRELGVRLALDDFGTGYSSLSQLSWVPLDILKIDRSCVSRLGRGERRMEVLVSSLVGMAHALGITAIAEGVETAEQSEALRLMGCGLGQGYYFSEPLPESEATELLEFGRVRSKPPQRRS